METVQHPPSGFTASSFQPDPWLRNPHLQTLAAALARRLRTFSSNVETCLVGVDDAGNQVRCDCSWQTQAETCTTAVISHGLGGSCASPIVIGMASALWEAGMNVVRYNMRNCGGTEDQCRTLYHSGMHRDVQRVIESLIARGCESLVLVGFSAGGNLMLNTAAAFGSAPPPQLKAVASICGAMDVAAAADALHVGFSRFYEWHFVRDLARLFRTKVELFPEAFRAADLDRRFKSIREFDHYITAPYSGFRDSDHIYSSISSSRWAENISVPTLVLQAADDPFIRLKPETREKLMRNPLIAFVETEHGGHCGFLGPKRQWWAEDTVRAFFAWVLARERAAASSSATTARG